METRESFRWPSKWPGDGGQRLLSRRVLLASALAPALKGQKPEVSSFDFSLLEDGPVPAELFFVREHFPAPAVSAAGWKLSVTGAAAQALEIPYEALAALPRKMLPVTLECAENPPAGGLVSHAEWAGFPLRAVLEKAGARPDAQFVRLSGADGFSRVLPLAKAAHPDTLVAQLMNGDKLPARHGFPLRAIIPGWYGMDSVKWLRGIELLAARPPASQDYVRLNRSLLAGTRPGGSVTAMQVKAEFARPLDGAILVGRHFKVRGAAWAGENRIQQVEVTTNGGNTWQAARLSGEPLPYAWVQWTHEWKIPGPGRYDLAVRAADDRGRRQPADRDPSRADSYELNTWQSVRVNVT